MADRPRFVRNKTSGLSMTSSIGLDSSCYGAGGGIGDHGRNNKATAALERELTPEEYKRMIDKLKAWAKPRTEKSKTATGLANARLIEKIAEDGLLTKRDAHLILHSFNSQRGWWQVLILMDTLIMAILLPVLIYEEPAENKHFSESMRHKISLAYHTCLAISFYLSIIQLFVVLLLFALSSYLIQMKSILYLYIHGHNLFVYLNTGGLLIVPSLIMSAILGHILVVGPIDSIPSSFLGCFSIVFTGYLYTKVIKPLFSDIFNAKVGAWGGRMKNHADEEARGLVRSLSMSFQRLKEEGLLMEEDDLEDPPPSPQSSSSRRSSCKPETEKAAGLSDSSHALTATESSFRSSSESSSGDHHDHGVRFVVGADEENLTRMMHDSSLLSNSRKSQTSESTKSCSHHVSSKQKKKSRKSSVWASAQAPNGDTYYYHKKTGETTWDRPPEYDN